MGNAYLGWSDWTAAVTSSEITASSERTGFEATNLLKYHPDDRWEVASPGAGSFNLVIDSGAINAIRAIAIMHTNATSSAIWRIRTSNTEAGLTSGPGGSPTDGIDVGGAPGTSFLDSIDYSDAPTQGRHGVYIHSSEISNRWMRFDIIDTGTPGGDDVWRAGRLMVCSGDIFGNNNINYGSDYGGYEDRSTLGNTVRGRGTVTRAEIVRTFEFSANFTTEADVQTLMVGYEKQGRSRDWLFVRDRDATTRLGFGAMGANMQRQFKASHNGYSLFPHAMKLVER